MKQIEYHITDLRASLHPVPGETKPVAVNFRLEMGEADLLGDDDILQSNLSIELDFLDETQDVDEDDPRFGDLTLDMIIYLEIEEDTFSPEIVIEDEIRTWNDEGYRHVDPQVIQEIEGDIIAQILSPLSQLLSDSFRNIIPRLRFTYNPDEFEDRDE